MDHDKRAALAALVSERAERVAALEAEARQKIERDKDQAAYERLMRAKAELLSELAVDADPLLDGATEDEAAAIRAFSMNAGMALQVGSVFFMSALLYPDDHQPGQPNNLEILAAALRQG